VHEDKNHPNTIFANFLSLPVHADRITTSLKKAEFKDPHFSRFVRATPVASADKKDN
jgi:hypothetical protein